MRIALIISILILTQLAPAQTSYADSLKNALENTPYDSVRYKLYVNLSSYYYSRDRKTSFEYNQEALIISRKNNMMLDVAEDLGNLGYYLNKEDRYGEAFNCFIEGIQLAEETANEERSWRRPPDTDPYQYRMQILSSLHHDLGHVYRSTGNNIEALHQFRKCLQYKEKALPTTYNTAYMNIGAVYLDMDMLDSALYYQRKELPLTTGWRSTVYKYIGDIHFRRGDNDSAFVNYHKGLHYAMHPGRTSQKISCEMGLAQWHLAAENKDSSLYYASNFLKGLSDLQGNPLKDVNISTAYELLYEAYRLREEPDSTSKYLQLAFTTRDSISKEKISNLTNYQNLSFNEQLRLVELEKEKMRTKSRMRVYSLLTGLVFILIVTFILYRNARQKQRANTILEKSLTDLKSTQAQLIQSEKMASLGQLTAGIAHEIKNPLNFVNNFSEVSLELIEEAMEEVKAQDLAPQQTITEILKDIESNLRKIHEHGSRADGIVTSMLQHSRTSSGQQELTDFNALCDEYLRLSYHGLRAKDKSFNADFKTDFDPDLPHAEVIPQDMGRVLLNLINNAFYAVKTQGLASPPQSDYKPTVTVSTKNLGDRIEISVKDNGSGIPEHIKDKIFQPFFTTKPTGQGTGLGLSLSYDIVKAHGGELKVETKESEGTDFIIILPLS